MLDVEPLMLTISLRMPRHTLPAVAFTLAIACHLPGQTQPSAASSIETQRPLKFEVSTVHPHQGIGDPSNRQVLPGGRFVATATSVRTLIRIAFGTDDKYIHGAPGWIDNETFDISATIVDHAEVKTPEEFQQVLLSLLEDRFGLKFHRSREEGPVFWLEVDKPGKLGPLLKPSAAEARPNMSTNSNGARTTMKVSKATMADVAAALRRQAGRPVEDHTNLQGTYDFEIKWAPDPTPDSTEPSLVTVLQDELGLKLRSAKGSNDTLVIDQISHPSDN